MNTLPVAGEADAGGATVSDSEGIEGEMNGDDWMRDRIGAALRGENPLVIARMRSGYAVIGDYQLMPGYCVLLAAPQVNHLSDLPLPERTTFLADMSLLGEAIMSIAQPRRMNYEILGNTDEYLHAHVWPRYEWEPQEYRGGPVWRYPREQRFAPAHAYSDERHGELRHRIGAALQALMREHGIAGDSWG